MDTKAVYAGNVKIGGGARVTVQSMTNTDTRDAGATISQIRALADAGAEIVRVSVSVSYTHLTLPTILLV